MIKFGQAPRLSRPASSWPALSLVGLTLAITVAQPTPVYGVRDRPRNYPLNPIIGQAGDTIQRRPEPVIPPKQEPIIKPETVRVKPPPDNSENDDEEVLAIIEAWLTVQK